MNATTIMKAAILAATVGLLGQAGTSAGLYETTVLSDGATHYWRLGEDTGTTAVNRANPGTDDGTYTGGYTLGEAGALFGDSDTAISVDGSTGYVNVGDLGARPSQGSIEFWMNSNILQNYRNPFCTSGIAGYINEGFRFEENGSGNFHVRVGGDGGAGHRGYTLTNSLAAGKWYHVVATWDDTTNRVKAYLNGSIKVNVVHPTALATNFSDVEIGRGFSGTAGTYPNENRWWDGLIDEVAMYNVALTEGQIEAHYLARIPEPSTLLLAGIGLLALVGTRRRKRK